MPSSAGAGGSVDINVGINVEAPREQLTARETEVVRLMAGGYSNREIALALGRAEGTIKNHVSSILAKFGARDRTRAVLKALETGFCSRGIRPSMPPRSDPD